MGPLFSRVDIFDVLQHRQETLNEHVDQLDSGTLDGVSEQDLVQALAGDYKLEVPVLEEDKTYITHREIQRDVSGDPMRPILDRTRPFYVKATEITFHVPFKGDSDFFEIQPTTYNLNRPQGEIDGNEIHMIYTSTDNNAESVKTDYQNQMQNIKQHLAWLEASVADFNGRIGQQAQGRITRRRQQLAGAATLVASIGLPVKQTSDKATSMSPHRAADMNKSITSPKKWDVFICHASEDKDQLVRELALALKDSGLRVWYDEFSMRMGDSLRSSIDYGLANSRYGVVVLSSNFFAKDWPVKELNGLTTREVDGKTVILPIWHKVTAEEVRRFSPMLADKLASSSDAGVPKLVEDVIRVLEKD